MNPAAYYQKPIKELEIDTNRISVFIESGVNTDAKTVASFGEEWLKFGLFTIDEIETIGLEYFDVVPEGTLTKEHYVLDAGCGTGRWSCFLATRVGFVEAIDPSLAVISAVKQLNSHNLLNSRVTQAEIDNLPFEDEIFDWVVCLGVLHHVPDTQAALNSIVRKLKPGGRVLLYFYYSLDNRGPAYKALFYLSSLLRHIISALPRRIKHLVCDIFALILYMPFIFLARVFKAAYKNSGFWKKIPLSYYHNKTWTVIRNDSLDRFGTPLEKRFTKIELRRMVADAGLIEPVFSDSPPYWHFCAQKPL